MENVSSPKRKKKAFSEFENAINEQLADKKKQMEMLDQQKKALS
jgi:hypothetical protein